MSLVADLSFVNIVGSGCGSKSPIVEAINKEVPECPEETTHINDLYGLKCDCCDNPVTKFIAFMYPCYDGEDDEKVIWHLVDYGTFNYMLQISYCVKLCDDCANEAIKFFEYGFFVS